MSSPLAIGAVSAVLRNLLDNGLIDVGAPLSPVRVTAVAPDTIKLDEPEPTPSLNLFLYRTSRNLGWANEGLPSFNGNGERVSSPPLALNLHYLVTAYGSADFQAEILLGYAMHLLPGNYVVHAPQTANGQYTLLLGPNITDNTGNLMNQNGNTVNGQIGTPGLDDRFLGSISFTANTPPVISPNLTQQTPPGLPTPLTLTEPITQVFVTPGMPVIRPTASAAKAAPCS